MPSNKLVFALVAIHAIVAGYHGWYHFSAMVPTTLAQNFFIATVVMAAPLLAAVMLARGRMHAGLAIFTSSMLGALLFGVGFHFVLDTPDLCSNVSGTGARGFFLSAAALATVELIGATAGAFWLTRLRHISLGPGSL